MIEQRVIALALAFPTVGPQRISDELARHKWGLIKISPNAVNKVLRRHGLNTKAKRLGLLAGYAAPHEPIGQREAPFKRQIEVSRPCELVRVDLTAFASAGPPAPKRPPGSTPPSTSPAFCCAEST